MPELGDIAALAALAPIEAVGTDEPGSAEPPPTWDPLANYDHIVGDPDVVITQVPDAAVGGGC